MFISMDVSILPRVRLIGHVIYSSPWMHFPRTSDEYILYLIKKGELYIREEECEYVLRQGDFLILEPNKMHCGYRKSLCDYYYVHFKHPKTTAIADKAEADPEHEMIRKRKKSLTSSLLSEMPAADSLCLIPKNYHIENSNEFIVLLNEIINEYYRKYEYYKEQASCRVLDLFIRIGRAYVTAKMQSTQAPVSKAFVKSQTILNYLNREYHGKISSTTIEQTFESNYDYLNRIFHKSTGFTILNYLNMLRINKAKEIIETTPLKFSEIGYLVGLNNQYYFSKLFKKYTGMTPTQYWEMFKRQRI